MIQSVKVLVDALILCLTLRFEQLFGVDSLRTAGSWQQIIHSQRFSAQRAEPVRVVLKRDECCRKRIAEQRRLSSVRSCKVGTATIGRKNRYTRPKCVLPFLFVVDLLMLGVLNLNKPPEKTSRDVVNVVQRIVKPAKVGHAGTLDPLATGVLLVCVGPATRLISVLQQAPKTYVAEFRFGERSDTDDCTGTVEVIADAEPVSEANLRTALQSYVGTIDQIPPAFSAVKVKGQRAYAKARRGEEVQLSAKQVVVYEIELLSYTWPVARLSIRCGSGTYIRSIARDLGVQLQCGGLMSALERTAIGEFNVANAVSAEDLNSENLSQHVTDAIQIVSHLPRYCCSPEEVTLLKAGRILTLVPEQLHPHTVADDPTVALVCDKGQHLLAMAEFIDDGARIQPRAVFC